MSFFLSVVNDDYKILIDGQEVANITEWDIETNNGVIHKIDALLLPSKEKNAAVSLQATGLPRAMCLFIALFYFLKVII